MQDVVATLIGAGLFSAGIFLKHILDKVKPSPQQNKEEQATSQFIHTSFPEFLLCGHIETVAADEDDPWGFLLEPCEQSALVIMGGLTLCEDHRDSYLLEMSPKK